MMPSSLRGSKLHWFIDHAAINRDEGVGPLMPESLECLLIALLEPPSGPSADIRGY